MPEKGRQKEFSDSLFYYEYDDGSGYSERKTVSMAALSSLWGYGIVDILTRGGFKRLTLEVGRRKATITPTIS